MRRQRGRRETCSRSRAQRALKCKIKGPDDIVEAVRAIVRHNASPPPTLNPLPHVLAEPLARVGLKTFTFNDTVAGPSRGSDIELKACFVLYQRVIWLELIVYGGRPFSMPPGPRRR